MVDVTKTVFISYRRDVSAFVARAVFQNLRENGYDVFMDVERIDSGDFSRIILNQIAARMHFVIILAPSSLERCTEPNDWLRREIEYAIDKNRNIVPLLLSNFKYGDAENYMIGKLQFLKNYNSINISHEFFEEGMLRLQTRFLKPPEYAVPLSEVSAKDAALVERAIQKIASGPQPNKTMLNAEDLVEVGYKRARNSDFDGAIEMYNQAIQIDPGLLIAYQRRAKANYNRGDLSAAQEDTQIALALNSTDPRSYILNSFLLELQGKYGQAIQKANEAIQIDPHLGEAYLQRGRIKVTTNDLKGAIEDFTTAIDLNTSDVDIAYNNRGISYYNLRDYNGAINDIDNALNINPNLAIAYFNRALCSFAKNDFDNTLIDFNKSISINPKYAPAYYNRGLLFSKIGERAKAFDDFTEGIRLNSEYSEAYIERAKKYDEEADVQLKLNDCNRAIQINPKSSYAHLVRGAIYHDDGDYRQAIDDYNRAIGLDIYNIQIYRFRAKAYHASEKTQLAIADYQRYLILGGGERFGDRQEIEQIIEDLKHN